MQLERQECSMNIHSPKSNFTYHKSENTRLNVDMKGDWLTDYCFNFVLNSMSRSAFRLLFVLTFYNVRFFQYYLIHIMQHRTVYSVYIVYARSSLVTHASVAKIAYHIIRYHALSELIRLSYSAGHSYAVNIQVACSFYHLHVIVYWLRIRIVRFFSL